MPALAAWLHARLSFRRRLRKLIEATRAQIERRYTRPASEPEVSPISVQHFHAAGSATCAAMTLRLYQKAGLEGLVRRIWHS